MGWGQETGKGQARAEFPLKCLVESTYGSLNLLRLVNRNPLILLANSEWQNLGVKYEHWHLHLNSLGFLVYVTHRMKQCCIIANITCSESKYHCHQC